MSFSNVSFVVGERFPSSFEFGKGSAQGSASSSSPLGKRERDTERSGSPDKKIAKQSLINFHFLRVKYADKVEEIETLNKALCTAIENGLEKSVAFTVLSAVEKFPEVASALIEIVKDNINDPADQKRLFKHIVSSQPGENGAKKTLDVARQVHDVETRKQLLESYDEEQEPDLMILSNVVDLMTKTLPASSQSSFVELSPDQIELFEKNLEKATLPSSVLNSQRVLLELCRDPNLPLKDLADKLALSRSFVTSVSTKYKKEGASYVTDLMTKGRSNVELSADALAHLEGVVNAKSPRSCAARVLVIASQNLPINEIVDEVGKSQPYVRKILNLYRKQGLSPFGYDEQKGN